MKVERPTRCPHCKRAGLITFVSQRYNYDDEHPQRFIEPLKALVRIETTWACDSCKQQFVVESEPT